MSGNCRPSLRKKTLYNVLLTNSLSNTDKKCIESAFKKLEYLERTNLKLVNVKDKLPEKYVPVLCLKKSGDFFIGRYIDAKFSDEYYVFLHAERNYPIGVSHWMPLPRIPKEYKQNDKEN